ncbi:amidohydrolase family protein [Sinanaerobacter chloroacetimidivorans]|uniref:Amidohydrolase family protein n=1 Tax=Sinanaerobacter chloroacetimidivorans TaxID=2818044 RepID=A0A8J7W1K7_9FIRM|nr:amidohydrolase family protein [Sinanaerobacter chloroacetimidivorans]MBR0597898.1 amidohydrolase family protein [Sinanaerobacter chloroacetimidivorans]
MERGTLERYDVAIINGKVADVVRGNFIKKNIGVTKDKITAITTAEIRGKITIDAAGMVVSPGFIDFHSHVDGNKYSATCLVKQGGTTTLGGERNLNSKAIRRIEEEGFIVNQGFSISQSFVLRNAVGISDADRPATDQEIKAMADLATRFMEYGAFGICFGLELVPGTSLKEILSLAEVAKNYDRPLLIHLRKDGREGLKYFDEIIKVTEETGVSVQILQLMYMVGIGGAMPAALEIIEEARSRGLDITADSGVYDAFSACIGTGIFEDGWEKEYSNTSVNDLLIASGIHMGKYCDADLFKLLREQYPETLVTAFVCDVEAIGMALKKDYVYVSTNAAEGPHYPGIGAPEVSGTFPRLLGRYVREDREISLMDAIRKITILPAKRFGLEDKGSIELNKNADLVIFDINRIIDRADFIGRGRPDASPEGIEYVIVNGKIVVNKNELTENCYSGKLIRRNGV